MYHEAMRVSSMTNSATEKTNVVELRHFAGNTAPKISGSAYSDPAPSQDSNDRFIADGLQLVRSFMLIEDVDMRASIIRMVEKIAEQNSVFNK
jgi:hypothetical protein